MNRLPADKRAQILQMMVEGVSIRAISRMTGASKNTIVKPLADAGNACADYQDKNLRGLTCKRLQVDEIWSFVYAKAKNVPTAKAAPQGAGDVWTWTAIDADTKLVPSFFVGGRDSYAANVFMRDLADRLTNRRAAHQRRQQGVSGCRGAGVWRRHRLRHAGETLRAG